MDTPKGSLIIPKSFLGGLLKLLWNDASFIYSDSVDHTKHTNSSQNVPWSVPNGAQEIPKDTQETASNQNKPPRTPK